MRSDELKSQAAERLRWIMTEMDLRSVNEFADLLTELGAPTSRSQASNWLNAYHLPSIEAMIVLCERAKLSLDWLYRGSLSGLDYESAIRLSAYENGVKLPRAAAAPRDTGAPAGVIPRKKAKAPAKKPARARETVKVAAGKAAVRKGASRPRGS